MRNGGTKGNRLKGTKHILLATAIALTPVLEASADTLVEALARSKVSGSFRLRHEAVEVDSAATRDAGALTLRSRLGIETAPLAGFSAVLEFEDTRALFGEDDYAPQESAPYRHAAIVDPEMTEINRAYLRYRGIRRLALGLGRQRLMYDNQRFIGNVGWRQDEQTFDAFSAQYTGLPGWTLSYAYVDKVNGIAGERPLYNFDVDSSDQLLNASYGGFSFGRLTGYAYLLENDEPAADLLNLGNSNNLNPALRFRSNDTYGLRFDGFWLLPGSAPLRLLYTAEYAWQELTNAAGAGFETDYYLLEAGVGYASGVGMLVAKVAQERLGSDGGLQGFQTPYATKHAFNGWADMFLNTPATGLVDSYVTLSGDFTALGVKALAMYHEYGRDEGSGDFGDEWNLQLIRPFGAHYLLGIKYARYRADSDTPFIIGTTGNVDTDKFWLWAELSF